MKLDPDVYLRAARMLDEPGMADEHLSNLIEYSCMRMGIPHHQYNNLMWVLFGGNWWHAIEYDDMLLLLITAATVLENP